MEEQKSKNKRLLGKEFLSRVVVSKSGKKFGEVSDLIFDTKTGEIVDITLNRPTQYIKDVNLEVDSDGDYLIPYHAVIAVGDFIVVSEEEIV